MLLLLYYARNQSCIYKIPNAKLNAKKAWNNLSLWTWSYQNKALVSYNNNNPKHFFRMQTKFFVFRDISLESGKFLLNTIFFGVNCLTSVTASVEAYRERSFRGDPNSSIKSLKPDLKANSSQLCNISRYPLHILDKSC